MFTSEEALVDAFTSGVATADSCFPGLRTLLEFGYAEGRADVVGSLPDGDVLAFEAKLRRWKEALHQAYRNTFYAHYSYVILPMSFANEALRRKHEFERRGVGLCTVGLSTIEIRIAAQRKEPVKMWLTRAIGEATGAKVGDANRTVSSAS